MANVAIHGVVQGLEREAVPLGALPWSSYPVERVSYSGKRDIDGYSVSSSHPDYSLFARPSIRHPDRWQIGGNVWLPMDWGHWLLRLLGRGRPRTTIYQMFIGETFPDEREAVQAAESWLGRVLRGEADQAEVLLVTL